MLSGGLPLPGGRALGVFWLIFFLAWTSVKSFVCWASSFTLLSYQGFRLRSSFYFVVFHLSNKQPINNDVGCYYEAPILNFCLSCRIPVHGAAKLTLAMGSKLRMPVHGAVKLTLAMVSNSRIPKLTLALARVSKSRIPGHGWSHKVSPTSDDAA